MSQGRCCLCPRILASEPRASVRGRAVATTSLRDDKCAAHLLPPPARRSLTARSVARARPWPDPLGRHRGHRRLRRHRLSRGDRDRAGGALPRQRSETTALGEPRDLTLVYAAGQGDGKERGLNHLGHRGPGRARHRRPLGAGAQAAGARGRQARSRPTTCRRASSPTSSATSPPASPGHLTRVGLGTFVDPRHGGGKLNARTTARPRQPDADRRRGVPVLQGLPDQRRHRARHHRRPRRQRHDGARGADAGGAGDRHGGAQLRRHRHRAGRAHRRARQPQPAAGQDPRHPGRLRRRRRAPRAPHADLRRALQRRPSPARSACR